MEITETEAKMILELADFTHDEEHLTNDEYEFIKKILDHFPNLNDLYKHLRKA